MYSGVKCCLFFLVFIHKYCSTVYKKKLPLSIIHDSACADIYLQSYDLHSTTGDYYSCGVIANVQPLEVPTSLHIQIMNWQYKELLPLMLLWSAQSSTGES